MPIGPISGSTFVPSSGSSLEPTPLPAPVAGIAGAPGLAPGMHLPSAAATTGGVGLTGAIQWTPTPYSLPPTAGLGAATIHRYDDPRVLPSTIAISVFTPVPTEDAPGVLLDINAKKHHEILPHRSILGDAGLTRAFIGVDKREGTPLDEKLDAIVAKIPRDAAGNIDPETAIQYVRVQTNQLIAWTAGSSANDGRAEFSWDKAISVPASAWDTFSSVAFHAVGSAPVSTGLGFPVVPLEKYLELGQGYCIQKALLASLILERCQVPHRLVNGAVSQGPGKSVGHTWIELADGRVLDPAWKTIATPTTEGAPVPGFFKLGGSWRFENQTFPYLSLA